MSTAMKGDRVERAVWRFGGVQGAFAYVLMNALLVGLVFMSWRLGQGTMYRNLEAFH